MEGDYEEECLQNRLRNKALLESIGLGGSLVPPPIKKNAPKLRAFKKRKAVKAGYDTEGQPEKPNKAPRIDASDDTKVEVDDTTGLRRSGRSRIKVDYNAENATKQPRLASAAVQAKLLEMNSEPRSVSKRIHDPKIFGVIPGIPVGTWWETREECSIDAVHAPMVAGISGGPDGAYSVALSGGYEDDVDLGELFTYTGSGGRDLKGTRKNPKNLRTAPQSSDQSFDNTFNKALKISSETQKPIRVIRGFKLKSPYAPAGGYRYDGLYTVEKAWMERGLNKGGYKVCKFAFKRVPGQAPLQFNDGDTDESGSEASADAY